MKATRAFGFLILAAASCAPSGPSETPAPSATSGSIAVSATPSADATSSTESSANAPATNKSDVGWSWRGAELGHGFYKSPITLEVEHGICRFVYDEPSQKAHTECISDGPQGTPRRWGWDEASAFVEDAALVQDGGTLFVARHSSISTGCVVYAYDIDSGDLRWVTRLMGLGPIEHSEYLNDVELTVEKQGLVVRGWESGGRYIETLDRSTGATKALVRLGPNGEPEHVAVPPAVPAEVQKPGAAERINWGWSGAPKRDRVTQASAANKNGLACSMIGSDGGGEQVRVACADPKKGASFGFELTKIFVPGVALAVDERRVYVGRYSSIATGTRVLALDATTGQPLWQTYLYGVGPVSHSKYRNDVQIQVLDKDRIVVFGAESGGKYVEVLDAATGADLGVRPE